MSAIIFFALSVGAQFWNFEHIHDFSDMYICAALSLINIALLGKAIKEYELDTRAA